MKNFSKTVAAAVAGMIGSSLYLVPATASAVLADGSWTMAIVPTPSIYLTSYDTTIYNFGTNGNWNSGFTYGGNLPGQSASLPMTDNGNVLYGRNSAIGGDGFAGVIEMQVSGGSISVPGTGMTGSIDSAGNMIFNPAGRQGLFALVPALIDLPFYIDDAQGNCYLGNPCTSTGNTAWTVFTTGAASSPAGTINGATLMNAGDLDGDGIDDFRGYLVSAGQIGSMWGSFFGTPYFETWQVEILSGTSTSGFNVDAVFGGPGGDIAQYASAVPLPAAAYLFGSGLLGLAVMARKKTAVR